MGRRRLPTAGGLTERQSQLLGLIVQDYLAYGVPVASETLARRYGLRVSPATIRHDMGVLESEGYVVQPHTSAGRIPADKGYRFYVEIIQGQATLPWEEQVRIRHQYYQTAASPDEWVRLTGYLLSRMVENLAFVAPPRALSPRLKHLDLVYLHDFLALLLVILQETRLLRRLLDLPQPMTQEELTSIAQRLTALYHDRSREEIMSMQVELTPLEERVRRAVVQLLENETRSSWNDVYWEGWKRLAAHAEMQAQTERVLRVMEIVEEGSFLPRLFSQAMAGEEDLRVFIGTENGWEDLQEYSVVIGRYGIPGSIGGVLGVFGPTRMPYSRAIASVRFFSGLLNEIVGSLVNN